MRNLRSFYHIWIEIFVRIVLIYGFIKLESMEPFQRQILPDEIWIYRWDFVFKCQTATYRIFNEKHLNFRFPKRDSIVPVTILWPVVTVVPLSIYFMNFLLTRSFKDLKAALLGHSLSFGLNGVLIGEHATFYSIFISKNSICFVHFRHNEVNRRSTKAGLLLSMLSRWRHELWNELHGRSIRGAGREKKFPIWPQLVLVCHVGISELLLNCKIANFLRWRKGQEL